MDSPQNNDFQQKKSKGGQGGQMKDKDKSGKRVETQ